MKKITLVISSLMMMFSHVSKAQDLAYPYDGYLGCVPGKYTYSGAPYFSILTENENAQGEKASYDAKILDSKMNVVKSLHIPCPQSVYVSYRERAVVKPTGAEIVHREEYGWEEVLEGVTIESSMVFANYMNAMCPISDEDEYIYVPYIVPGESDVIACCIYRKDEFYLPTFLGLTYPNRYYVLRDNSILEAKVEYKPLYEESVVSWVSMGDENTYKDDSYPVTFTLANFETGSEGNYMYCDFFATQTLFNDDEAWEYFVPVQEERSEVNYVYVEGVTDEGVVLIRSIQKGLQIVAFNIVSEEGSVLASLSMDNFIMCDDYLSVIIMEGDIFINAGYWDEGNLYDCLYRYDKEGGDLDKVAAVRRSNRFATLEGDRLDVNLEDADANGNLLLTNSLGKVLHSEKVQRGKGSATINTSSLPEGIYNVTLMQRGKVRKNQKMLIK